MSLDGLRIAYCSHGAARFACENWHYAAVVPTGKRVCVGAWEHGEFIGAVVFSRGASPHLGRRYDLDHTDLCELTRVALRAHTVPVSAILTRAVRLLRQASPGLRLVVSFADPVEGHHGGIYQASGWYYTGVSGDNREYHVGGRWRHERAVYYRLRRLGGGDAGRVAVRRHRPGKHRYVLPLDKPMRRRVARDALPYPEPVG